MKIVLFALSADEVADNTVVNVSLGLMTEVEFYMLNTAQNSTSQISELDLTVYNVLVTSESQSSEH